MLYTVNTCTHMYSYVYVCMYIYIHTHRERDRYSIEIVINLLLLIEHAEGAFGSPYIFGLGATNHEKSVP